MLIFANPIAGKGKGRFLAERIGQSVTAKGYRARIFLDRAEGLSEQALYMLPEVRALVVIGGDGTLRTVVSRIIRQCPSRELPPFVVVPMGTANLLARHLGLHWQERTIAEQVAEAISGRKTIQIDAATANGELFLLMAGVGIDAKVVHELDRLRRGPISMVSYALPAALALTAYRYPSIEVQVDGQRVFGPQSGIAMVGNIKEYGTGFPILPFARSDDSLLDLCAMPCGSPPELAELFLHALTGEHTRLEGVVYLKGKQIQITSESAVPVQLDGDAAGFTPVDIQLLDRQIPFIVQTSDSQSQRRSP